MLVNIDVVRISKLRERNGDTIRVQCPLIETLKKKVYVNVRSLMPAFLKPYNAAADHIDSIT
jgi:hypothetical protein